MTVDNRQLPIDPKTGYGLVCLRIPAARPGQPDTVRAEWHSTSRIARYPADTGL